MSNNNRKKCETVTFGVIAFNEQKYLPSLLSDLIKQTYKKKLIEVILVDGGSADNTKSIMQEFKNNYITFFRCIKVLDNLKRVQPAGWNVVIDNAECDVILRIDAHARLPENYIEKCMLRINAGEDVCGGPRENIIDENTGWKKMLLNAEQSMFGAGIASYRQNTNKIKYVKSVFHGAYRREIFRKVGIFNEALLRTEDNEFHYRIRAAEYRICYDPEIKSYYQTRNTLSGMLKQKYQNGYWIGRTLFICPKCISIFHLVPFGFVCALITTAVLAVFSVSWPLQVLCGAYCCANLLMIFDTFTKGNNNINNLLLPGIFFLLHTFYGIGTIGGILSKK